MSPKFAILDRAQYNLQALVIIISLKFVWGRPFFESLMMSMIFSLSRWVSVAAALLILYPMLMYSEETVELVSYQFDSQQVENYHHHSSNLEPLSELIAGGFFAHAESVLDVGCGVGNMAALLATELPECAVVGCDISESMIALASQHYQLPNLSFVEEDARRLGFDRQFDRIISFNCLHWVDDQPRALRQIYASLKPHGKALIVAAPEASNDDFKRVCRKVIISMKWAPHFINFKTTHSFHTMKEYKKLLSRTGFNIERMEQVPQEMTFPNREALESFLSAVLTPLAHLSARRRPTFLNDFYKQLVKDGNVDADGVVHIHYDQIEFVVSKNSINPSPK